MNNISGRNLYMRIEKFDMKHMCYHELSSFGHFGRKSSLFEQLDKVKEIENYIKKHS